MPPCVRQQVVKLSRSALDHLLKQSFPQHLRHCCRPCGLGSTAPSRPSLHSGQVLGSNCQPCQDPLPKPLLPPRALRDHLTKFNLVAQLCLTWHPHGLQHTRPPCPSPTPRVCSNSYPSSWCCHPTLSSSVVPFSCLQSFPASGSFPMSQFFPSGGQSIRTSPTASVLPMNIQD